MKVGIIDHQPVYRLGLQSLLAELECRAVCEFETARQAIIDADRLRQCDLITVERNLPDIDGISLVADLRRKSTTAPCLILATFGDPEHVRRALQVGAHGYALKTDPVEETKEAIRRIATGTSYISPALLSVDEEPGNRSRAGLSALSRREREVFDLAIQGLHGREIAQRLFISAKTVESHRYKINQKLGIHSIAELVRFAALHNLLTG